MLRQNGATGLFKVGHLVFSLRQWCTIVAYGKQNLKYIHIVQIDKYICNKASIISGL